jgi:hypothetical protein
MDEMKDRLLLDVVIGETTTVLELLANENKVLLVRESLFLIRGDERRCEMKVEMKTSSGCCSLSTAVLPAKASPWWSCILASCCLSHQRCYGLIRRRRERRRG